MSRATVQSRVIFGDEVTEGMTLLIECEERSCRYPAVHGPRVDHEATLTRRRTTSEGIVIYGVLTDAEDGQHAWQAMRLEPVRVRAAAPAEISGSAG